MYYPLTYRKMNKKLNWILAAAFGFLSVTAFAQDTPAQAKDCCAKPVQECCSQPDKACCDKKEEHRHKAHAGNRAEIFKEMEAHLQLTPEQSGQLKAMHEARRSEMKALKENTALSKEEKRTQMKAMHQQNKVALQQILSEEQFAKLQDMRKEKMQERKGKQKGFDRKGK